MPGHRILVVEDNPLNLKLVRDVLTASGYDVVEARTGEDGVALAADCDPDLVLMDLQLPGIDGYEALRAHPATEPIRRRPGGRVTAFAMREDRERNRSLGLRRLPRQTDQRPRPPPPGPRLPGRRRRR